MSKGVGEVKNWNDKITMQLNHRDILIFKQSLELMLKQVKKNAKLERKVFGTGAFSELEDYCEHLQRCIDAALSETEMTVSFE